MANHDETTHSHLKEIFQMFDKNQDGVVTGAELLKVIESFGKKIDPALSTSNENEKKPDHSATSSTKDNDANKAEIDNHNTEHEQKANDDLKKSADELKLINFDDFAKMMTSKSSDHEMDEDLEMAFRLFDRDGDGVISVRDLEKVLSNMGEKVSKSDLYSIVRHMDSNGDGLISYDGK